ncbi:MAG: hypothetical protein K2P98_04615, partial [Neisseriaceae bacterium]|nr:hypothetical protein [Neisseriaceae bacterium]
MTSTPAIIDKWSLPIIAANGSLEQYISSVNATPLLTQEEELE